MFPPKSLLKFIAALVLMPLFVLSLPVLSVGHGHMAFAGEKTKADQKWVCPMHPHYIADEFGSCPICGMDLVKLPSTSSPQKSVVMGEAEKEEGKSIFISPQTIQNMGVRTAKAETASFGQLVRSYGVVKENERLLTEISARVEGWVEKLNVTAVGDQVKEGEQLLALFSPELIVSQRDYLTGLKAGGSARQNIMKRLLSFGVQRQVLDQLKRDRKIMNEVPFYAGRAGTITALNVTPGSYVKRGMTIAKIQDFSVVWVMVNVSEKDMVFIRKGTPAKVYFPNVPGKEINSKVDYIYPEVDERTRTGRVRLVIDNSQGHLRPGTYADVVFDTNISRRLSVPSEAILKSERGDFVVLSLGKGQFSSREVKVGLVSSGRAEIKSGVKDGDEIVISAQFLIDSESALRESFIKFEKLQQPLSSLKLSKVQFAMFDHMVDAAIYLHEAMIEKKDIDLKFLDPAISIKQMMWPDFKDSKLAQVLLSSEKAFKVAQSAKTKTEQKQSLNDVVQAIEPWLLEGAPDHYKKLKLALFEDMATGNKWLQQAGKPANPYGDGMSHSVDWPDASMIAAPKLMDKKSKTMDKMDNTMRGSHGGMKHE